MPVLLLSCCCRWLVDGRRWATGRKGLRWSLLATLSLANSSIDAVWAILLLHRRWQRGWRLRCERFCWSLLATSSRRTAQSCRWHNRRERVHENWHEIFPASWVWVPEFVPVAGAPHLVNGLAMGDALAH